MRDANVRAMRRADGFTMIELMITLCIIGVVVSVALVSYGQYLKSGEASVVYYNYAQAIDRTRNNYVAARQLQTMGASVTSVVPDDTNAWVDMLNETDGNAPGGGPAYQIGVGDAATGAIGVQVLGTYATRNSVVTITRPAYAGMPASTFIIAQIDF